MQVNVIEQRNGMVSHKDGMPISFSYTAGNNIFAYNINISIKYNNNNSKKKAKKSFSQL